ncbi:metal-dependent hydrolase [Bifidobacterium callitrichos]|uniref:Metal-dependent hydrolase n=1 Tax=Bifidobacterium callitrichos TaxID=762209 RepID=A0A2T3G8J6_9BIFI|nr:metal-dependent hydrolase [Bifidobacterium callitrichos]
MYLRIKPPSGEIVVSAPARMSERMIVDFVRGRREWIDRQRERMAKARHEAMVGFGEGEFDPSSNGGVGGAFGVGGVGGGVGGNAEGAEEVGDDLFSASGLDPFDGDTRSVDPVPSVSPSSDSPASNDGDDADFDRNYVWTDDRRKRAEAAINAALPGLLDKWTPIVGKSPTHITLRLMTSRWGSCTPKTGRIRLNLQLGLMEPEFLEYVLVHELTHLWERGHGERFRARMDAYLPRWRDLRRELNRRIVL